MLINAKTRPYHKTKQSPKKVGEDKLNGEVEHWFIFQQKLEDLTFMLPLKPAVCFHYVRVCFLWTCVLRWPPYLCRSETAFFLHLDLALLWCSHNVWNAQKRLPLKRYVSQTSHKITWPLGFQGCVRARKRGSVSMLLPRFMRWRFLHITVLYCTFHCNITRRR